MNITAVSYVNDAHDKVFVNTTQGFLTEPWPSSSDTGAAIQAWIDAGNTIQEPPQPDFSQLQSSKMAEINNAYQAEIDYILRSFPDAETKSFDRQEQEARAWAADNSAATPYLDWLLSERPLTKADLVGRIIQKAEAYAEAHGKATGKRQRLEDQINDATSIEELNAISW